MTQQRSDSVSGVEAIYQVVNKMVLLDDSDTVQVARQSSMTVEEESAYDTLENVLKSMRGERHTPFSPSPTAEEQRGVVTPEPVKPAPPTESKATPTPAAAKQNEQPGLKSTVSTVWFQVVYMYVLFTIFSYTTYSGYTWKISSTDLTFTCVSILSAAHSCRDQESSEDSEVAEETWETSKERGSQTAGKWG